MDDQKYEQIENVTQDVPAEPVTSTDPSMKKTYKKLVRLMKAAKIMTDCSSKVDMYKQLSSQFQEIKDYKDSQERSEKCLKLAKKAKKRIKKQVYEKALELKNNAKRAQDYYQAAKKFKKLKDYQDAPQLAKECEELGKALEKKSMVKRIMAIGLIIILLLAAVIAVNTSYVKYQAANVLRMTGRYETAIRIYKKLDGYKDSIDKKAECQYLRGVEFQKIGDYKNAWKAFSKANGYKDSREREIEAKKTIIRNSEPGDTVRFGNRDWVVLEVNDGRALLLLKTALPGRAYHESLTDVTWETSDIRKWLNSDFLTNEFSEEERRDILLSEVKNEDNPVYGTDGGNDTRDYVFFLSVEEAAEYQELLPTMKSNCWLRSPGSSQSSAAFLAVDKNVMEYGYVVDSDLVRVRPVMWVGLE